MPEIPDQHPIQVSRLCNDFRIPKAVALQAYEVYSHYFSPQEAMITGDCRGGFGLGELIAFLYAHGFPKEEWRERVAEAMKGMQTR